MKLPQFRVTIFTKQQYHPDNDVSVNFVISWNAIFISYVSISQVNELLIMLIIVFVLTSSAFFLQVVTVSKGNYLFDNAQASVP